MTDLTDTTKELDKLKGEDLDKVKTLSSLKVLLICSILLGITHYTPVFFEKGSFLQKTGSFFILIVWIFIIISLTIFVKCGLSYLVKTASEYKRIKLQVWIILITTSIPLLYDQDNLPEWPSLVDEFKDYQVLLTCLITIYFTFILRGVIFFHGTRLFFKPFLFFLVVISLFFFIFSFPDSSKYSYSIFEDDHIKWRSPQDIETRPLREELKILKKKLGKDGWELIQNERYNKLRIQINKIVINARKTETVKNYILAIFFIYAGLTAGLLKEGFVKRKNAF
jgi:hypothetical protein